MSVDETGAGLDVDSRVCSALCVVVFAFCTALASCSSRDSVETPDRLQAGGSSPGPREGDASAPKELEPNDNDGLPPSDDEPRTHVPDGNSVQDRCLGESCGPAKLPAQPELVFLEELDDGWQRLVEMDWEVAAASEGYRCKTFTIPEDIYVTAYKPQVPHGTHHVVFDVVEAPSMPDAVFACAATNLGERKLNGAGVGTEPIELPAGVAQPLRSGQQIHMNLHLFNLGERALQGRAGMWVKTVPASAVEHEAEVILAGPLSLDIPIGRSTRGGSCTVRADATLYSVGPHMHQKGVHMRATAITENGEIPIYDDAYDFNHQLWYTIDAMQLKAGDRVDVECTYENDTDRPLRWGDSALDEMCFINLSVYPAIGYGAGPCFN
jgi:hypothetical protein